MQKQLNARKPTDVLWQENNKPFIVWQWGVWIIVNKNCHIKAVTKFICQMRFFCCKVWDLNHVSDSMLCAGGRHFSAQKSQLSVSYCPPSVLCFVSAFIRISLSCLSVCVALRLISRTLTLEIYDPRSRAGLWLSWCESHTVCHSLRSELSND